MTNISMKISDLKRHIFKKYDIRLYTGELEIVPTYKYYITFDDEKDFKSSNRKKRFETLDELYTYLLGFVGALELTSLAKNK